MIASKTGLPCYLRSDGKHVYAAKITGMKLIAGIQQQHPGATTLSFGDIDKQAHLIPKWMSEQKPVVGGYFVVEDADDGSDFTVFVAADKFESTYARRKN